MNYVVLVFVTIKKIIFFQPVFLEAFFEHQSKNLTLIVLNETAIGNIFKLT